MNRLRQRGFVAGRIPGRRHFRPDSIRAARARALRRAKIRVITAGVVVALLLQAVYFLLIDWQPCLLP